MPLTDSAARTAKPRDKLYRLSDTLGLSLEIPPTGSKLWRFRYLFAGNPKMISLGSYPAVTLAKARELRDVARSPVAAGVGTNRPRNAPERPRRTPSRNWPTSGTPIAPLDGRTPPPTRRACTWTTTSSPALASGRWTRSPGPIVELVRKVEARGWHRRST